MRHYLCNFCQYVIHRFFVRIVVIIIALFFDISVNRSIRMIFDMEKGVHFFGTIILIVKTEVSFIYSQLLLVYSIECPDASNSDLSLDVPFFWFS